MSCVPCDIWAVALQYAFDTQFSSATSSRQMQDSQPHPASGLFLLCRSLAAAIDEWYMMGMMERGLKGSVPTVRLPPVLASDLRVAMAHSIQAQKRSFLALTRAPKELLSSVRRIEGAFLHAVPELKLSTDEKQKGALSLRGKALSTLFAALDRLVYLDGPFLQCSTWLDTIDLRPLTSLRRIGNKFVSMSRVEGVLLPAGLVSVGDFFLHVSSVNKLQFSGASALTMVGDSFLEGAEIALEGISWPINLKSVGSCFCVFVQEPKSTEADNAPSKAARPSVRLDLSRTNLETVGNEFFAQFSSSEILCRMGSTREEYLEGTPTVRIEELLLPATLLCIGDDFLFGSTAKRIDLRSTFIEVVGDHFLAFSSVEELLLPSSLKTIGEGFLFGCRSRRVDLTETAIETIGWDFLNDSVVEELLLPPSLKSLQEGFLCSSRAKRIDLSKSFLTSIGADFLASSDAEEVLLPSTLTAVGDRFLERSRASRMTISAPALEEVGKDFMAYTEIGAVSFPTSLRKIGDGFLRRTVITHLDLRDLSRLESFGEECLASSKVEVLGLPPSLRFIGDGLLLQLQAEQIDLSRSSLERIGDSFLAGSRVREVHLPSSLKRAGDRCFFARHAAELDLRETHLEEVGAYFLGESNTPIVRLPPSLKVLGDGVLFLALAKRIDLTCSSVKSIGDEFLAESMVEELLLPPSLTAIGTGFLFRSLAAQICIVAQSLVTVGPRCLEMSRAVEVVLPPSLQEHLNLPTHLPQQKH